MESYLGLPVVGYYGEVMFYYPRGINMRYLGLVAELSTCRTDLDHLFQLCITEMINRTAKKLLSNELHQGMCVGYDGSHVTTVGICTQPHCIMWQL